MIGLDFLSSYRLKHQWFDSIHQFCNVFVSIIAHSFKKKKVRNSKHMLGLVISFWGQLIMKDQNFRNTLGWSLIADAYFYFNKLPVISTLSSSDPIQQTPCSVCDLLRRSRFCVRRLFGHRFQRTRHHWISVFN